MVFLSRCVPHLLVLLYLSCFINSLQAADEKEEDEGGPEKEKSTFDSRDCKASKKEVPLRPVILSEFSVRGSGPDYSQAAIFFVDQSVVDLNVSYPGGRFQLWKITDAVKKPSPDISCLTRVTEASPGDRLFVFKEGDGQDTEGNYRHSGCREFTAETCTETDLMDEHDSADQHSCSKSIHIELPSPGMRYIKLFPDTDSVQVDKPPADSVQNKVTISGLSILDMERKHHFIHDGTEKALQTSPIAGGLFYLNRTFTCPALVNLEQTHLVALDEQGQELSREDMPGEYYGMLDVPREKFYLGIDGVDIYGGRFNRIVTDLIEPRTLVLSFTTPAHTEELNPEQNLDVPIRIRNEGEPGTFRLRTEFTDFSDILTAEIYPYETQLDQTGTRLIHVLVSVNGNISQEIHSELKIEAWRLSDNSSTYLTRPVTATTSGLGEDKQPPVCTTVRMLSFCVPSLNCSRCNWGAILSIEDESDVYMARISSSLSAVRSMIIYMRHGGRMMAEVNIYPSCCVSNVTVVVEDYMGNNQECVIERPSDGPNNENFCKIPDVEEDEQRSPVSKIQDRVEKNSTNIPGGRDTTNTSDVTGGDNTSITRDCDGNDDISANKEYGFWTPEVLSRLRVSVIFLGCFLFATLLAFVGMSYRNKKKQISRTTGIRRNAAFHFGKIRSWGVSSIGQKGGSDIQMYRLNKALSGSREAADNARDDGTDTKTSHAKKACSSGRSSSDEQEIGELNKVINRESDGGTETDLTETDSAVSSPGTSIVDEAYSSEHNTRTGSCRRRNVKKESPTTDKPRAQGKEDRISQMNISDIEPKNKTDIYDSILQFRIVLDQLEKKRTSLMSSMGFKPHTVPRIKSDIRQPEMDWDVRYKEVEILAYEDRRKSNHDKLDELKVPRSPDTENSTDTGKQRKHSVGESPLTVSPSCISPPAASTDTSKTSDSQQGEVDTGIRRQVAEVEECNMGEEKTDDPRKIMTSVTPPELSAGEVNMVIEGATQISLRHQILELKDRLLQCNKDVEDAIRLERDYYDSMSLDSDISDSDCEKSD